MFGLQIARCGSSPASFGGAASPAPASKPAEDRFGTCKFTDFSFDHHLIGAASVSHQASESSLHNPMLAVQLEAMPTSATLPMAEISRRLEPVFWKVHGLMKKTKLPQMPPSPQLEPQASGPAAVATGGKSFEGWTEDRVAPLYASKRVASNLGAAAALSCMLLGASPAASEETFAAPPVIPPVAAEAVATASSAAAAVVEAPVTEAPSVVAATAAAVAPEPIARAAVLLSPPASPVLSATAGNLKVIPASQLLTDISGGAAGLEGQLEAKVKSELEQELRALDRRGGVVPKGKDLLSVDEVVISTAVAPELSGLSSVPGLGVGIGSSSSSSSGLISPSPAILTPDTAFFSPDLGGAGSAGGLDPNLQEVSFAPAVTLGGAASFAVESAAAAVAAAPAAATLGLSEKIALILAQSVKHFGLGGVAGALGAAVVYPLDTVKTRMQVQKKDENGEVEYKDEMDCLQKVVKKEGVGALYSGLVPQLVGIAPEKAIKLTVNELLLAVLEGVVPGARLWVLEIIAGSGSGFSQVVFTNPVEIVKVRMQTQEQAGKSKTTLEVIKELGPKGLYSGSTVTMARDVPSTAIFFAVYAAMKQLFPEQSFIAGCVAAIPAAILVTPMDVVKTRLQMEPVPGQDVPKNGLECAMIIIKNEGPQALFAGGWARVLRMSPQFGITLMVYDLLCQ